MPYASPNLRQLRVRAGIKPGRWAEQVQMSRGAYSLVENGHRSASEELFGRCAARLTDLLGETVETDDLIAEKGGGRDLPRLRNSTARGTTPEAAETAETTEATATTEARERGVA